MAKITFNYFSPGWIFSLAQIIIIGLNSNQTEIQCQCAKVVYDLNLHAARTTSGKITLEAGKKYPITVFFSEAAGSASMKLEWSSANQSREVVPTSQLYSTSVATSTPTPTPTPTPVTTNFCANENGFCSFSGTQQVRYGANGQYFTKTFTNGTDCTNAIFGDPIVGVVKTCAVLASRPTPKPRTLPLELTQRTTKKLIGTSSRKPTPDFFRQNIKQMEQHPFDGVILQLNAGYEVFKKTPYPDNAFTQDQNDLAVTKSSILTDNFVIMSSGMENGWDWFNDADWAAAEKNIQNFAKTAAAGSFRGIAFDPEAYSQTPWVYNQQPQHNNKTFEEYQRQVRKRGAQFMSVLQATNPSTKVLTLSLLSLIKDLLSETTDPVKLQQQLVNHDYGLWPAFINGMLDAMQSNSVIIDGDEGAYYFYNADWFKGMSLQVIPKDAKALVDPVNSMKYDNNVKVGQAVYMNFVLDLFEPSDKSWYGIKMPHFLSPDDRLKLLEYNTYYGLQTADQYVWIYGENMDWWRNNIPNGAEDAIRRAKTKIQNGQPLGFDINAATNSARNKCKVINPAC